MIAAFHCDSNARCVGRSVCALAFLLACGVTADAQQESSEIKLTLLHSLESKNEQRTYEWIGNSQLDDRILAIEKSVDSDNFLKGFALWEFGRDGEILRRTPIVDSPAKPALLGNAAILAGAVVLDNDEVLIVGSLEKESHFSIFKFDARRNLLFSKSLKGEYAATRLRNVTRGPNDTILLLGSTGNAAKVIAMDSEGDILWNRDYVATTTVDTTPDNVRRVPSFHTLSNVVLSQDRETMLLVGQTGESVNKFGLGPMQVWLLRCDSRGGVIDEHRFPGRSPSVAGPFPETRVMVLFDSQFEQDSKHVLVGLDSKSKELWSRNIDMGGIWVYQPDVVKSTDARCMLAGYIANEIQVREYDTSGQLISSGSKQIAGEPSGSTQVICTNHQGFVSVKVFTGNAAGNATIFSEIYRADGL
jgi:hypothetical protein